ncbi:MAG: hypothetical protein LUD72_11580 [Bacteroidales bacterium]|nr:hypothetical protein [Bacteroidales bacterium]
MRTQKAERAYVSAKDVTYLLGIKEGKAYEIISDVNEDASSEGYAAFPRWRAKKGLFAGECGIRDA